MKRFPLFADGSLGDNGCRGRHFGENRQRAGPREAKTAGPVPSGTGSSDCSRGRRLEPADVPAGCVSCRIWQAASGRRGEFRNETDRDVPSGGESRRDGWCVTGRQWRSCRTSLVPRGTCQWKASLLEEAPPPFTRGGVEAGLADGELAAKVVGELRGDGMSEAQSLSRPPDEQSGDRNQGLAEAIRCREASGGQQGGRPPGWQLCKVRVLVFENRKCGLHIVGRNVPLGIGCACHLA